MSYLPIGVRILYNLDEYGKDRQCCGTKDYRNLNFHEEHLICKYNEVCRFIVLLIFIKLYFFTNMRIFGCESSPISRNVR